MRAVANRRAGRVEVDPGLKLWREVTVYGEDYRGFDVAVRVAFDGTRMTATEVKVEQRQGGPAVTGEALRSVTVDAFVRHSVRANFELPDDRRFYHAYGLLSVEDAIHMGNAGPTDETLRWVARLYRLALATGEPPTTAIRQVFHIAPSTAGQWVARARAKGLLGPPEGPGKAGG